MLFWLIVFALGAVAALLKFRFELALATVVAWAVFEFALPLLYDLTVDIVFLPLALALLGLPLAAMVIEGRRGSLWDRGGADDKLAFVGQLVGVLLMFGLVIALAYFFVREEIIGGAITMAIFAAAVGYAFLPGVWAARDKLR